MSVWALSDLHLNLSVPEKSMEVFGPLWKDYVLKIETNWRACVREDDLVLVPGDICWASKLDEAKIDLAWIEDLPGTKVMLKGNHDYWWSSKKKVQEILPPSIQIIHHDALVWNDYAIGGSRLWDTDEYSFEKYIHFQDNPKASPKSDADLEAVQKEMMRIYNRELERLRLSLEKLDPNARIRIALTHYPPIGADLKPTRASKILEEFKIDVCVFGHLHSLKKNQTLFGTSNGIRYIFASGDYIDFQPIKVF